MATRFLTLTFVLLCAGLAPSAAVAQEDVSLHVLSWQKDPEYHKRRLQKRFIGHPLGRPKAAAEVAIRELRYQAEDAGVQYSVAPQRLKQAEGLNAFLQSLPQDKTQLMLLDLPSTWQSQFVSLLDEYPNVLAINVSASDNALRGQSCHARYFHSIPSERMLNDALAQYLINQKWRKVLLLHRQGEEKEPAFASVKGTLKRFGLSLEDTRPFVLERNPQKRFQNNTALLTRGRYDIVWVADSDGEFARELPYQTQQPRPVVGDAGLVPMAWHWSWERNGGPQLNRRFIKKAKRLMGSRDWAMWIASKALVEVHSQSPKASAKALAARLRAAGTRFDGFKSGTVSFRPWNNQLRQPIFLSDGQWVVAKAPLDGFLHPTENLDTLGDSKRESACEMK